MARARLPCRLRSFGISFHSCRDGWGRRSTVPCSGDATHDLEELTYMFANGLSLCRLLHNLNLQVHISSSSLESRSSCSALRSDHCVGANSPLLHDSHVRGVGQLTIAPPATMLNPLSSQSFHLWHSLCAFQYGHPSPRSSVEDLSSSSRTSPLFSSAWPARCARTSRPC